MTKEKAYYQWQYPSPLGTLTALSDGEALLELSFEGQRYFPYARLAVAEKKMLPVFEQTGQWLECYFAGKEPGFTSPVRLEGTPFQQQVWEILQQIPYGQTVTYGWIAKQIAAQRGIRRMSAQAVGGAVGRNPVNIIVPCHRVIGTDGNLVGYGGGLERKIYLLQLEGWENATS